MLLMVVGVMQLDIPQVQMSLWVNERYSPWTDMFFQYYTRLGEVWGFLLVGIVLLLLKNHRLLLLVSVASLTSSLVVQFLKHQIFPSYYRPSHFFGIRHIPFRKIPDLQYFEYFSFPSGHTTSAFTLACVLAMGFPKRNYLGVVLLLLAFGVGFSRVYLFQHFVADTYFGSMLGVGCGLIVQRCLKYTLHNRFISPLSE